MTLLELLQLMRKHLKLVIALPIICALVALVFSFAFLPNTYTASVSMYILSSSASSNSSSTNQSSDLTASQMLTNDVAQLIKSDRIKDETKQKLNISQGEFNSYKISVTSSTTTRLISLTVTGSNPQQTAAIANGLANTTNTVAQDLMGVEAVNVIDQAATPNAPSGPPRLMYTAVAFLVGLFAAIAAVVIMDMMNTRIRKPEELEELFDLPVIGRIPVVKG